MIEVKNKKNYAYLFENYEHSIPLIEASINDEYESHLYLDKENNPSLAILTTPFYSMYLAGDPTQKNLVKTLDSVIWKNHIPTYHQKKLYAYAPNGEWSDVLDSLYALHDGQIEARYQFVLNKEKFEEFYKNLPSLDEATFKLQYRNDRHAKVNYPSISCFINDKEAGFSTGYSLAKGVAQIDTHTFKDFRGKGIAKQTSARMIKELLDRGLEVTYICNPAKESAIKLAKALGFEKNLEISVRVWKSVKK